MFYWRICKGPSSCFELTGYAVTCEADEGPVAYRGLPNHSPPPAFCALFIFLSSPFLLFSSRSLILTDTST